MARLYTISFSGISPPGTAPQDFFEVLGVAGKRVALKRFTLDATDSTIPTSQMVQISWGFATAGTPALGSGTSPTKQAVDPGDAAASFTALVNSTTLGAGTRQTVSNRGFHVYNGIDEGSIDPAQPPLMSVIGTELMFVELLQAVSGTVHFSGTAWVEESNA